MDSKSLLVEILDYYKRKVEKNLCTMEEMEAACKVLQENMEIYGTIGDFADFYGKSKDAVNSVIKRRMIEKPKRNVVLYRFRAFQKLIPPNWRRKS